MHIGHVNMIPSTICPRVELRPVNEEKDLGVTIADDLRPRIRSVSCQPPRREKSQAWCAETSEDSIAKTFSSTRLKLDDIFLSIVSSHGRHI